MQMERKIDANREEGERIQAQSREVTIDGNQEEVLRREIASHSLYGQLVESHLDCLKMCLGISDNNRSVVFDPTLTLNHPDLSELDRFMEDYCVALKKLKEVMEVPQQETMAFINHMYSQLEELLVEEI